MKNNIKKFELISNKTDFPIEKITTSDTAYKFIKRFYANDIDIFESVFILLLNRANNTVGYAKISQGGLNSSIVDIKIIAKYAVESLSCGVILAHNHPSGNNKPSIEDINISKKLKDALKILDVSLMDSLIITENTYYSLADNGII